MSAANQITQKQAVIDAVSAVLGSRFTSGTTNVKSVITEDETSKVRDLVSNGIIAGDVVYSKNPSDTEAVKRYTAGLIENHFRKAKELNGGNKYVPSNPRPRRAKDEQIVTLNKLLETYAEGTEEYKSVQEAIANRYKELGTTQPVGRKKKVAASETDDNIDMSVLPEDLRSMLEG